MKIIFLDNFGVLCLANKHGRIRKKDELPSNDEFKPHGKFNDFDKLAVQILNSILEKTGAEIVVSSDWKNWSSLDEMKQFYLSQGIIKIPIDFTPFFNRLQNPGNFSYQQKRCLEILNWLDNHSNIDKWVAVDDMYLELSNFVWVTRSDEGLCQEGIKNKILDYLTN